MLFRKNKVANNEGRLLEKLQQVKELLYYALCRPEEFKVWADNYLAEKERIILSRISKELSAALLQGEVMGTGMDVNELRSRQFYLSLLIENELAAYSALLGKLPVGQITEDCKLALIGATDAVSDLLAKRREINARHANTAGWKGLELKDQKTIQFLRAQVNDYVTLQFSLIAQLEQCDELVYELRYKLQSLNKKLIELFDVQIQSEAMAINLAHLQSMQAILLRLSGNVAEQEKGKSDLSALLCKNRSYRDALANNMPWLSLLHKQFIEYLANRKTNHFPAVVSAENGDEFEKRQKFKERAKEKYAIRSGVEMARAERARAQQRLEMEAAFKAACAAYEERNFKAALPGFLAGVNKLHAASFFNVGSMLLQGHGCNRNPKRARYYLAMAYVLENSQVERELYLPKLLEADKQSALFDEQVAPENEDINNEIKAAVLEYAAFMKAIFRSQEYVMERFFRAGELLIYLLSEHKDDIDSEKKILFKKAIRNFRWACKYIDGICERRMIVPAPDFWDCQRQQEKRDKLKADIVSRLDLIYEKESFQVLRPRIDAFYRRYAIRPESELVAGYRAVIF